MPKWTVPVSGKLLVEATTEENAKLKVAAYLLDRGLTFLKANSYGVEEIQDTGVVPVVDG